MSWQYDATEEERAAAALLRGKGWIVSDPPCPDCRGFGFINRFATVASGGTVTVSTDFTSRPCPRGCVVASYFHSTAGSR